MVLILLIALFAVGCVTALVAFYWWEFSRGYEGYARALFLHWFVRGIVTPLIVWLVMNLGAFPFMPPLTPFIAQLRAKGNYAQALAFQMFIAAMPIVSLWATFSFGYFLNTLFRRAKNTDDLVIALILWGPVAIPLAWFFWYASGKVGIGFAAVLWSWPLTQYLLTVADISTPPPSYSRAIAKIKFGKYGEAEMAIIRELEKSETDFDGWMMLAELYAQQYHDLAEAERTVYEVCNEPATTQSEVSLALQRLADWYLKLGSDPVSARRVLEDLCQRVAGTHLALMARQRINQIPESRAQFEEQTKPQVFAMPALNDSLDEADDQQEAGMTREAAMASVNQLIERLNQDPNDVNAREKMARLFAEPLEKFELALEQLELLLGMPMQPERKVAEWLALLAVWQIKLLGEGEEAKQTLQRLIREFPTSAQAFAAQRRLNLMNMSAKMRPNRPVGRKSEAES